MIKSRYGLLSIARRKEFDNGLMYFRLIIHPVSESSARITNMGAGGIDHLGE